MDEFELVTVKVPRFFLEDLELTAWDESDDYTQRDMNDKAVAMATLAEQVRTLRGLDT